MELTIIKSASIILQNSSGEVYLCKRSKDVSFFPGFWVFPGGKIEEDIPDEWQGTESEVYETIFKEMYEEIGVVAGSPETIPADKRHIPYNRRTYDPDARKKFKDQMVYVGKKQTPPFRTKLYNAAYYWIEGEIVDRLDPEVDGNELVEGIWIKPEEILQSWKEGKKKIPPPILHLLRNMKSDHFVMKTLNETSLPVGLQTKVEFAPGYQMIPISSNTIPPFFNTNMVIVEDSDEILITDPGASKEAYDHAGQLLLSLKVPPKVFITHHHSDHWDGLSKVEELYPDTVVMAHHRTLSRLKTSLEKVAVSHGEEISVGGKSLKVIHTPGHTDSHMSLFDEEQNILIAGDHVVGYGSAVLDPNYGDMKHYFETTRNLIEMGPQLILPSHGPPNFAGKRLLKYYLKHRQEREDSILTAIENGNHTLDEIVKVVYDDVPKSMWDYAKRNIELHIDKLETENKLPNEFNT